MNPSPEIAARLEERYAKLQSICDLGINIDPALWNYLHDSELQLIQLMTTSTPPAPDAPGGLEFSWTLYFLNNDIPTWLTDCLTGLGMPATEITSKDWSLWSETWEAAGVVGGDGTLFSFAPYAQMDPGWSLAALDYILQVTNIDSIYPFQTNKYSPLQMPNETSITVAVFGDWGTGSYQDGTNGDASPSQQIADLIKNKFKPDICIHLGDVYYAGSEDEETDKLIGCWPQPQPQTPSFTLNSNHEMYSGATGYFTKALGNTIFNTNQPNSYFQINFGNWILLGLDSAYYDPSPFYADGSIADPTGIQTALLQAAAAEPGKKVMIFTHHNPIDLTGNTVVGAQDSQLWYQVMNAMSPKTPDYWYWGHQHAGIIYISPNPVMGNTNCRCMGNAGIPIGNASWMPKYGFNVDTYMNKAFPNPGPTQTLRIQNGFALLTFTQNEVTEQWFYQDGTSVS